MSEKTAKESGVALRQVATRRFALIMFVAIAALITGAGCGDSDSTESETNTTPTSTAGSAAKVSTTRVGATIGTSGTTSPPPPTVAPPKTMPDVRNLKLQEAKALLPGVEVSLGSQLVKPGDSTIGTVLQSTPTAGSPLTGSVVKLTIARPPSVTVRPSRVEMDPAARGGGPVCGEMHGDTGPEIFLQDLKINNGQVDPRQPKTGGFAATDVGLARLIDLPATQINPNEDGSYPPIAISVDIMDFDPASSQRLGRVDANQTLRFTNGLPHELEYKAIDLFPGLIVQGKCTTVTIWFTVKVLGT